MADRDGGIFKRLFGGKSEATLPPGSAHAALFGAPGTEPDPTQAATMPEPAPKPASKRPSDHGSRTGASAEKPARTPPPMVTGAEFLSPPDLAPNLADGATAPVTVLLIGSCLLQALFQQRPNAPRDKSPQDWEYDFILANAVADFPANPPLPVEQYDFQVIQLPLRPILPTLEMAALRYDDLAGYEAAFEQARQNLAVNLAARMRWNESHGMLSLVCNFMQPQMPNHGFLLPRYDLRNIEYFVDCLNQELARLLAGYRNAYLLDIDRLAASFGRRHVQDDMLVPFAHNAQISPQYRIGDRIEPLWPLGFNYETRPANFFKDAILAHLKALHRAVLQQDQVKLVVTDLDDTLWKGVAADSETPGPQMIEGWPYGYIEALQALARRGILLGVISRNDEAFIREIWPQITASHIELAEFADLRINDLPKPENMRAMLAAMNLLPSSVVFIDDNPAERAGMQAAFPEMRVLGGNPFHTRRILLLAAETQVAAVTPESARRTAMVQDQIKREAARATMTVAEFARQQQIRAVMSALAGGGDKRFARVLELINKTNQFNTTQRRFNAAELTDFIAGGGAIAVLEVRDRYTDYGLTGVILSRGDEIVQFVMSCRVLGLGVERCALRAFAESAAGEVTAWLTKTPTNKACHGFFLNNGFIDAGSHWRLPAGTLPEPVPYVTFVTG